MNPKISNYFYSNKDNLLRKDKKIIIEGPKSIRKLIKSGIEIFEIISTEKYFSEFSTIANNTKISLISAEDFSKISGFKKNKGILAIGERPKSISIKNLGNKVLVLNGLTSPENVGSICRSLAAFNVNSLIIDNKTCSPFLKRCIRVSMGNVFFLKIYFSDNLKEDLISLQNKSYSVFSAANDLSAEILNNHFIFPRKSIIIIGSEGHGIDKEIKNISNKVIKIDINNDVAHLNASVAAAVILSKI